MHRNWKLFRKPFDRVNGDTVVQYEVYAGDYQVDVSGSDAERVKRQIDAFIGHETYRERLGLCS